MSQNHSSASFLLLNYDLVGQTDDFQSLPAMLFRPIMMELASRMSQNLQISPPPLHSPSENSKSQTKVEYAAREREGERAGVFASSYVGINFPPRSVCLCLTRAIYSKL